MTPAAASGRTWRGASLAERRSNQRGRLLVAGRDVFATRGFACASVEDIVGAAHVSRTSFYRFFQNKEDCLLEVFWSGIGQVMQALAPIAARPDPPEERVRLGVRALVAELAADPAMARVLLIEVVGATPAIEEARTRARGEFATFLADQLRSTALWKGAPRIEVELVAIATMAGIAESVGYLVASGRHEEWEAAVEPLQRYALRALAPGTPPVEGWA